MTIQDLIEKRLVESGLWPDEATIVVDQLKESQPTMVGRWSEDSEGYPLEVLSYLLINAKMLAIKHLEATKPQHFALILLKMENSTMDEVGNDWQNAMYPGS